MKQVLKFIFLIALCLVLSHCGNRQIDEDSEEPAVIENQQSLLDSTIDDPRYQLIGEITQAIRQDSSNADLFYERALVYIEIELFSSAVYDLNKAISIDPTRGKYFKSLAEISYNAGAEADAFRLYQKAYELWPSDIDINLKLALYFYIFKKYDKSIEHVNNVLKREVHNQYAYFYKGMNYKEIGDTAKAISSFQTAIEQEPDYYDAYMQVGLLMSFQKNDLALEYLNNALRLDSNSMEVFYAIAMHYQNKGEYQTAIQVYKDAINIDPQFEHAFHNIGYIYLDLDSIDKAFKFLNLAIQVSPSYALAYYHRGKCHEINGDYRDAMMDYQQALNFDPDLLMAREDLHKLKANI